QVVVDGRVVRPADPELDRPLDACHDLAEIARDVVLRKRGERGLVAAGDVEAHAGRRDRTVVGDDPTDRHGVAEVVVSHERARDGALVSEARFDLRERASIRLFALGREHARESGRVGLMTLSSSGYISHANASILWRISTARV